MEYKVFYYHCGEISRATEYKISMHTIKLHGEEAEGEEDSDWDMNKLLHHLGVDVESNGVRLYTQKDSESLMEHYTLMSATMQCEDRVLYVVNDSRHWADFQIIQHANAIDGWARVCSARRAR